MTTQTSLPDLLRLELCLTFVNHFHPVLHKLMDGIVDYCEILEPGLLEDTQDEAYSHITALDTLYDQVTGTDWFTGEDSLDTLCRQIDAYATEHPAEDIVYDLGAEGYFKQAYQPVAKEIPVMVDWLENLTQNQTLPAQLREAITGFSTSPRWRLWLTEISHAPHQDMGQAQ